MEEWIKNEIVLSPTKRFRKGQKQKLDQGVIFVFQVCFFKNGRIIESY